MLSLLRGVLPPHDFAPAAPEGDGHCAHRTPLRYALGCSRYAECVDACCVCTLSVLQRLKEMVIARIADARPDAVTAAAAAGADGSTEALSPAEAILDQTMNRVLIVKPHTPDELKHWLNQLTCTVSGVSWHMHGPCGRFK